jgi:endo-1,4-beta-D-glucanase Y
VAAEAGNAEVLEKVWEWVKEKLTTDELNTEFLLAKDDTEHTALHVAAIILNIESLEKIWKWAKSNLTTEKLITELLLAEDYQKKTAWLVAAEWGTLE